MAMLHRMAGEPAPARTIYEEVVRLARESGNEETEAIGLVNLAMALVETGGAGEALPVAEQALRIAVEIASAPAGLGALDVCTALAAGAGDWKRAARFFGAAEAHASRSAIRRDAVDARFIAPSLERARAALGAAAFASARVEGSRCDFHQALREALAWVRPAPAPPGAAKELLTASR
jgi:hypothetical protein